MLGDLLQRKPYNAVTDFVDAPVSRGLAEKIAFIDAKRSLSYGNLQRCTCRFAAALTALELKPEDSRSSSTIPSISRSPFGERCGPALWRCRSTRC